MNKISLLLGLLVTSPLFGQGLTKEKIQKVVRSNTDEVRSCYEKFTARTPGIAGKLRVEIKVDKDGHVETAKAADSTFRDANIGTCIEAKIRRWRFPNPLPGDRSTFSYPFAFGADDEAAAPASTPSSDARVYKGRTFKKSNRDIEDIEILQMMAANKFIKAKGAGCDNLKLMKTKCEGLDPKDRVVCSAMTDSAPKKPFTPDWLLIEHPDAFRIESGTYFMGYWHISCEELKK